MVTNGLGCVTPRTTVESSEQNCSWIEPHALGTPTWETVDLNSFRSMSAAPLGNGPWIGRTGVRMFKKALPVCPSCASAAPWRRARRAPHRLAKRTRVRCVQTEGLEVCSSERKTNPDKSASGVRECLSSPAVQRTFFGGAKGFPLSHIQMHASTCGDHVDSHVIWVD
ncbi:hypothetical protein J4Q44_G00071010 [Coregonus suidteri]|uniref:Uncharacterized protein n=1 Tax=Coregonus suidteri TaxID=861788 RepID=A0AAN8R2S2_9TELE